MVQDAQNRLHVLLDARLHAVQSARQVVDLRGQRSEGEKTVNVGLGLPNCQREQTSRRPEPNAATAQSSSRLTL